jgi:sec-independent protein translocase protein TatA
MLSDLASPSHLLILVLLGVLLFGAKRLPDLARGIGKSARILKAEVNGLHEDDEKQSESKPETKQLETKPAEAEASTAKSAETKRTD